MSSDSGFGDSRFGDSEFGDRPCQGSTSYGSYFDNNPRTRHLETAKAQKMSEDVWD
ncbi:hypothetical protein HNI00_02220 [Thermoleptolyngbya oregonensis NK1-22]|uniref:Uncharacterized protein n=1 Tax=Thermoleptolyngbya oregonensis NK1-22 TaxID=2547457 RepID=A0AA96YL03_9CYAN|nr:hypothetical protein [Thermoleptolyngbya oregonensis]WOB42112.1 hypothetical protein HNI00_02220 [Thermoleptolyngbya oregonensis NK1-22]